MNKPYIFLDLDQTLISAEALDEEYDPKKHEKKAAKFDSENMENYYIIFQRPGLQKFLDYLFANFNVCVWTAASKDYALFIIDKIILASKPERHLEYIFFSYHCNISKKLKNGTKDLSMLWDVYKLKEFNSNNTLILDDYDEVFDTQPNNCIIATPFYFTKNKSEKDKFLEELIPKLEQIKSDIKKNRPPLRSLGVQEHPGDEN
jgi:TFIIF-interacting CTD phosphatase-like protein